MIHLQLIAWSLQHMYDINKWRFAVSDSSNANLLNARNNMRPDLRKNRVKNNI